MTQLLSDLTARAALPLGLLFLLAYNVFILRRLHRQWMLLDLLGLFAVLQLWVAPALRYRFEALSWTLDPNNDMAVPASVYFPIVIPMVLALVAGLRGPTLRWDDKGPTLRWVPTLRWDDKPAGAWVPWIFLGLGILGLLAEPHAPAYLRQPCVLMRGLLWVAAAYGVKIPSGHHRTVLLTVTLGVLACVAVTTTFFGNLVMGLGFLGMVWLYGRTFPWQRLLVAQVVGAVLVVFLLSFKFDYRKAVKSAGAGPTERIGLFFTTAWQALLPPYRWESLDVALERLNQGVYVARVIAYVPAHAPYGYGKELGEAFLGAFVPRFLWPNKHQAGGQANRERFLGVSKATYSYNIGPVGEAWAHFGRWGFLYTFLYAWSLAQLQQMLLVFSHRFQMPLWLFSFYLFAPALLTEGDSGIVWNHVVKAGMVVAVFGFFVRFSEPGYLTQRDADLP